jgi:hypothetical protein
MRHKGYEAEAAALYDRPADQTALRCAAASEGVKRQCFLCSAPFAVSPATDNSQRNRLNAKS